MPPKQFLNSMRASCGQVKFIAVDGRGGSGKSTAADFLAKTLNAGIIHTDDFASWDNPINWWPEVIKKVFKPIELGTKTLSYPRTKWWESHNPKPIVNKPVRQIMILEGVGALRKEFREYLSFGIFVDTPVQICRARVVERDKNTGEPEEKIKILWKEWLAAENQYLKSHNPKIAADMVINGTGSLKQQLQHLAH